MATSPSGPSGLAVTLEVSEPVVVGLSVLATVSVTNKGQSALTVSSRLNLMEGDVQLFVVCPDGRNQTVTGAGGEADTLPREVSLQIGQTISGGMNLLWTSVGATFPAPGTYRLRCKYYPSVRIEPIESAVVAVTARTPQTDVEREVAALLLDDTVKRALVLAEPDAAVDALRRLATTYRNTPDGELAALILQGSDIAFDQGSSPQAASAGRLPPRSTMVSIVSTPFSRVGKNLESK